MAIPKRSYWLREVVTEAGTSYHISFRDGQGKIQKLCVSYDFYMAFRRLELDERKIEGWDYRHREFSEIMEETLNWRAVKPPKSIEELILEEERAELLQWQSIRCQKSKGGVSCSTISMNITIMKLPLWNIALLLR